MRERPQSASSLGGELLGPRAIDRDSGGQPRGTFSLSLGRFEVRDFSYTLLRSARESAIDRRRRQKRAVHEPLAVLLGVPDDRNKIPAVSRPCDVRGLPSGSPSAGCTATSID
jgi:hypothetical protein